MEKVLREGDPVVEKMTTTKLIVPPSGMMAAVAHALHALSEERGRPFVYFPEIPCAVEAALRWISEHPVVPDEGQCGVMYASKAKFDFEPWEWIRWGASEWQRRMFLDPGPEIPEEIKDLLEDLPGPAGEYRSNILEAYRRGKASR